MKAHRGLFETGKIVNIRIRMIHPNPGQPRKTFDPAYLMELSESIRTYGVLQPLSVRKMGNGYELIAGERRLRASMMAGLTEVPCIVLSVGNMESSLIALVENLQRQDLDFMEEAEGLSRLIKNYGLSQEEAARRVGKSQSAVANKLRLLRHPPEILSIIREFHLTERHARALLRVENLPDRISAALTIGKRGLNVMQADRFIDDFLSSGKNEKPPVRIHAFYVLKDVRLFINTVEHALNVMNQAGICAQCDRRDTENEILLNIHIPRRQSQTPGGYVSASNP